MKKVGFEGNSWFACNNALSIWLSVLLIGAENGSSSSSCEVFG